jgi:hypothetical protein
VCRCCGETEHDFLALDHVNDDGAEQRRQLAAELGGLPTGERFYRWLARRGFPDIGLQVLCHNCNHAKRLRDGCPHQRNESGLAAA